MTCVDHADTQLLAGDEYWRDVASHQREHVLHSMSLVRIKEHFKLSFEYSKSIPFGSCPTRQNELRISATGYSRRVTLEIIDLQISYHCDLQSVYTLTNFNGDSEMLYKDKVIHLHRVPHGGFSLYGFSKSSICMPQIVD